MEEDSAHDIISVDLSLNRNDFEEDSPTRSDERWLNDVATLSSEKIRRQWMIPHKEHILKMDAL